MSLNKMLDELTFKDLKHNRDVVIPYIIEKVTTFLSANPFRDTPNFFISNLLDKKVNLNWVISQCKSILDFIEFIQSDEYLNLNDENNQIFIMQHFFYDFSQFCVLATNANIPVDPNLYNSPIGLIGKSRTMPAQQFFIESKFNYFSKKYSNFDSISPFAIYSTPILIRQSIEIKIKELLRIDTVKFTPTGGDTFIPINKYLDFIKNTNNSIFDLPVNINDLIEINRWTNTFVHEAYNEFIWIIQSCVTTIEPLFSIQDDARYTATNTHGITFYLDKYTGRNKEIQLNNALHRAFTTDSLFTKYTVYLF
ncbi:hypothetical protein [Acinetobacter sp. TGL-Y2]|uniref:hypothetical protein n=1 Tax=Acinetobacter sp. TGL-Y2 TaxID=1407071 RepID=UPI001905B54C|nr:hypothetical protein [Acinetobacter sp. TGL-Y2]MBJ9373727.1 hypothetical protein [Acinetobacter sp. TGL-Y2]